MSISWNIRGSESLPALQIAGTVNERLTTHDTVVVTAAPGAGKSTLLPLTILQGLASGKILMLEPRRLAARQIAERMAWMLGEPVGQTVGYRVRFESKVSAHTRIEVLTEGILTRMLVDDPTLEGVSVVIFDEFHERSLTSDVALALTREARQIIRPDLRVVIMSATIDADYICQATGATLVESEGRMFPVDIHHAAIEPPMQTVQEVAEAVAHQVREAHRLHEGDILAFLPGEAEIRRCQELLQPLAIIPDGPHAATVPDDSPSGSTTPTGPCTTRICPLYGLLPPQEQRRAIAPSQPGERKIVLATPIAETSLTIEGVRVVVDSGLCRTMVFDAQSGLSHLKTVRISLDMARQRSGRAGRVAAGTCYRLWTLATEHRMADRRQPEILDADLAPMLLDIAAWGEGEAAQLPWLTPPPQAHLAQASRLLQLLDAIDAQQRITPHGRIIATLPCHPRMAQMLVKAQTPELKAQAADIAAMLEEKDPMASDPTAGTDLNRRLEALLHMRQNQRYPRGWERIARIAEQYARMANHAHTTDTQHIISTSDTRHPSPSNISAYHADTITPFATGRLLAAAYPERVARIVNEGQCLYRLASGEQAMLDRTDELSAHEWLAVACVSTQSGRDGHIFLASPLDPSDISDLAHIKEHISWDSRNGQIVAQRELRIGCLLIESKPLHDARRDEINRVICEAAHKEGTSMLDFNDSVQNLQRRIAAVSEWHPELLLPDLSTDAVLARTEDWLPLYLGKATTTSELKKIDLTTALWGLLDYEQQQQVERLAPTHIQVPTGSRIRVEYRHGAELPILRVRLQECFGLTDTPRVDNGHRAVLMELLSPGFKPVQLTQDLRSFWQGTYFEVRKELRRRYPKHPWPDDPLEAEAVRGVKRNGKLGGRFLE